MALYLEMPTQYGINATYHRITRMDFTDNGTDVYLKSYADQEARESAAMPLIERAFVFQGIKERKGAYEAIKKTNEFADATDV